jgi:CSLREA domain-containing protein
MGLRRIAVLTGLAALAAAAPAQAATFTVTTTADPPGAEGCTPAVCTLRSAITAAGGNGNATDDVIVMPAGLYTVTAQLGALTVPSGATRITFQGAGTNTTSIEPPVGTTALVIDTNGGAALTGLTLRGGTLGAGQGGNLLVRSGASLTLDRARITGGTAPQGGGIGALGAASITIRSSLIDNNFTTGADISNAGGGIYVQGQTTATVITIEDSTIVGNGARNGGGIAIDNNTGQPPVLRGVTLTRNTARAGQVTGVGGIYAGGTNARFQSSIVAGNLTTINLGGGPAVVAAHSGRGSPATDEGGNVTSDATDQCGLGGVHADPQLAGGLDSSQPPALAIPANSSAVDIAACGARTTDQRGVARPQGALCDAGAYEYAAAPAPTPTPTPAQPTPTATPTSTPAPIANRSVGAQPVRGTVRVKVGGKFVRLAPGLLKNGTEVDTRKGVVEITTAQGEVARFFDGVFKIAQARGVTTLTLTEKLTGCPRARRSVASAAAKKPKTRKLWGDGKGRFRTKGQYSAATVRGTKWLVQDTCTATLTRVTQGVVAVQDFAKRKTVLVKKGKRYTARAKRRR